jgi:hypothetical protein
MTKIVREPTIQHPVVDSRKCDLRRSGLIRGEALE